MVHVDDRERKLWRYAVRTFTRLLCSVNDVEYIDYKLNNLDRSGWRKFWEHYRDDSHIGENFIEKFVEFGFQSWYNEDWIGKVKATRSKKIRFNWIFSSAAIKRYDALGAVINAQVVRSDLKRRYKIISEEVKSDFMKSAIELQKSQEMSKALFLNEDIGFEYCVIFTTLYNHLSDNCSKCNSVTECKILLKDKYPNIYQARGYGNS